MTHTADCTVEHEERLREIGQCFTDHWDRCDKLAEQSGLRRIGSGSGRVVYVVDGNPEMDDGDCVVKFSNNINGAYQNQREVNFYDEYEGIQDILVPVQDHSRSVDIGHGETGYPWISMSRVETKSIDKEDKITVLNKLERRGWSCHDVNIHNIGNLHGDPHLIDYAGGCHNHRD